MADLSSSQRKNLPKSSFANKPAAKTAKGKAEPGSYPIPDANHARMALAMVSKHGSPAEKSRVRAAVKKKYPDIQQTKKGKSK